MRLVRQFLLLPSLIFAIYPLALSQQPGEESRRKPPASTSQTINCEVCHSTKSPLGDPPYRLCPPGARLPATEPPPEAAPEVVLVSVMQDEYEPVILNHLFHAAVTDGCSACHHHAAIGDTAACGGCHGAPFNPETLGIPGLKGAFHRQCISCHAESGSGPIGCTQCHSKKAEGNK
jgi:hypothetical protein